MKHTDEQIIKALVDYQKGRPVKEIIRENRITDVAFLFWRRKAGVKVRSESKESNEWEKIKKALK